MSSDAPCCSDAAAPDLRRRRVIRIAAAAGLATPFSVLWAQAAAGGPQIGDRLVEEDAEGAPTPLKVADLGNGKPLLAFAMDPKSGTVRNESRLHKVMLIKLPEAELAPDVKARGVGGVVAYSAICTHQGCDVKTWLSKEKTLVCFCHSSKFKLLEGGSVESGPATRALPYLPLKLEGDQLVVAGAFSAAPGGAV